MSADRRKPPRKPKHIPTKKQATPRDRRYALGVMNGKSRKQAALDAGFSEAMAAKPALRIETPVVRALIVQLLDAAGVSDSKLARRVSQGIDATVTKFFASNGLVTDQKECVDYAERRQMVELALRAKGLLVEKHEHSFSLEDLVAGSYGDEEPA